MQHPAILTVEHNDLGEEPEPLTGTGELELARGQEAAPPETEGAADGEDDAPT